MYLTKNKQQVGEEKLSKLRVNALENLRNLAKENIELTIGDSDAEIGFDNMSITEKKRFIKNKISVQLDCKLKEYIKQLSTFELEDAYERFLEWIEVTDRTD